MFNLVAGNSYYYDFRNESQNGVNTNNMTFILPNNDKKCPYSSLAKDGVIEYKMD